MEFECTILYKTGGEFPHIYTFNPCSFLTRIHRQEISHNQRGSDQPSVGLVVASSSVYLHVVRIPTNGEGEATLDLRIVGLEIRISQRTARQHRLLSVIEGDVSKFLPVSDHVVLDNDVVQCKLSLRESQSGIFHFLLPPRCH